MRLMLHELTTTPISLWHDILKYFTFIGYYLVIRVTKHSTIQKSMHSVIIFEFYNNNN